MSTTLGKHFSYELSDKKAKSNLLKGAGREALKVEERQKCTIFELSVGAFLEVVIPLVVECTHFFLFWHIYFSLKDT